MIPDAFASNKDYASLKMPVVIIAGVQDRLVDVYQQVGPPPPGRN